MLFYQERLGTNIGKTRKQRRFTQEDAPGIAPRVVAEAASTFHELERKWRM